MSFSIDANLLIYASDRDSPHFQKATAFLSQAVADPEIMYITWPTVFAYLRIATHPGVFEKPLPPQVALQNIDSLLEARNTRTIGEGDDFWAAYTKQNADQVIRGNLVPDAQLAALLLSNGVKRLFTRDRDFLKFPDLEVIDPFE